MPTMTYQLADGTNRSIVVPVGTSVMRAALDNSIRGIVGECGGQLTCATCHVHVLGPCHDWFPAPDEEEADLLEIVDDPQYNSRLSCQLVVTDEMDGLAVAVPAA